MPFRHIVTYLEPGQSIAVAAQLRVLDITAPLLVPPWEHPENG
jgi:hypothetical protein